MKQVQSTSSRHAPTAQPRIMIPNRTQQYFMRTVYVCGFVQKLLLRWATGVNLTIAAVHIRFSFTPRLIPEPDNCQKAPQNRCVASWQCPCPSDRAADTHTLVRGF